MKYRVGFAIQETFAITILAAAFLLLSVALPVAAQEALTQIANGTPGVQAQPPYSVSLFAQSVPGEYTAPDSITQNSNAIFIGFGNNGDPAGSSAIPSTIIKYDFNGQIIKKILVVGHNDGLKVNPQTGDLWALQNEDANATLIIFDPDTLAAKHSYFLGTGRHGGGYDDITFLNGDAYFSASNPLHNPNNEPAIVQFTSNGSSFTLTPVLYGNAAAIDITTGLPVVLNLQDPDSMTLNPGGDIVLDSQADGELVMVHNPGSSQTVFRVLLTVNGQMTTVDDTIFPTSSSGFMLVADTGGGNVYKITAPFLQPGSGYSASDSGGFVATTNFITGQLTPVVTGMVSAHGMAFVPSP